MIRRKSTHRTLAFLESLVPGLVLQHVGLASESLATRWTRERLAWNELKWLFFFSDFGPWECYCGSQSKLRCRSKFFSESAHSENKGRIKNIRSYAALMGLMINGLEQKIFKYLEWIKCNVVNVLFWWKCWQATEALWAPWVRIPAQLRFFLYCLVDSRVIELVLRPEVSTTKRPLEFRQSSKPSCLTETVRLKIETS